MFAVPVLSISPRDELSDVTIGLKMCDIGGSQPLQNA